jgi:tetratricopeptide (TPR) repeat protein
MQKTVPRSGGLEPGQAKAHYNLGVELQNSGKVEEAAGCYARAFELNPADADAANNLGNCLADLGRATEASAWYERAIAANPRHALAHYNLGNARRANGRIEDAIVAYRRAVSLAPSYADAYNNLGVALQSQGRWHEAAAAFQLASALAPNHAMAWFNLGNAVRKLGRRKEAIPCYTRAVEIKPDYADAYRRLGSAFGKERRCGEAADCYRRLIELDPADGLAHHELGLVLKAQGKTEEAIASYRRAMELTPDNPALHNNLGNAFKDIERYDEAIACYRRALEIDPEFPEARMNLALYHRFAPGDPELARLKALLEREDLSSDKKNQVRFHLGKAYHDIGQYDEAFAFFRQANDEMAAHLPYDPERNLELIAAIKRTFPDCRDGANGLRAADAGAPLPVFVLGTSRAGKSLVESILARHPSVYAVGENFAWFHALDELRNSARISERYPECVAAFADSQIAELGQRYLDAMLRLSDKACVHVNTMPGHFRHVGLIVRAIPQAIFIHCRRDPLDQCLSIYFKRYASGYEHSYDFARLAAHYSDYADIMTHWCRLYGDRILSVTYEDIVQDTAAAATRIFAHCGLDWDPAIVLPAFSAEEIGYARHYAAYLGPLREMLGTDRTESDVRAHFEPTLTVPATVAFRAGPGEA